MPSQSARATSAAEARFRIAAPNARPRSVAVVPLDAAARALLQAVAAEGRFGARFVALAQGSDWLAELAGQTRALVEAIAAANMVVLVATAGAEAAGAAVVAELCAARQVMLAAVVVDGGETDGSALETTLAALRPHATMLVVAEGRDYVTAMLEALRA
jgi:hypothetical protein